ncbi:DUF6188 family protein [Kineosporia sp. A_224]|uniref:DUF6188 family protein n=1 Tax=Kineosporia sp. A_224 TaxID=1962180 RepID=UPI000B4AD0F4|nr:DUF6188 family protein [Kineosporia sp. A_224]
MTGEPRYLDDRILLPFRDERIESVTSDFRLVLSVGSVSELVIETAATLSHGPLQAPGAVRIPIEPSSGDTGPAADLVGTTVLSSVAFRSGSLRLVFSSGVHVYVPVSQDYEAWGVTGPGAFRCISLPGGGLGVWS